VTAKSFFIFFLAAILLASCAGVKERKDRAETHYRIGEVYFLEKNYSSALEELSEAVRLNPAEPRYHNLLGLAYGARGMLDEARKEFDEAIRLNPEFAEAHVNLGAVHLELRQWDLAIGHLNKALANVFYKTPELARNNLGWAYYNKGDYGQALFNFKKAVDIAPSYYMPYYNTGLVYEKTDKLDEAASSLRKATELAPAFPDAYYTLGLVLMRKNDKPAARAAFSKVVELIAGTDRARSAAEFLELLK
jgi:tetratricopeptide (TPR) repeat protein